jgi:hypothetical protein
MTWTMVPVLVMFFADSDLKGFGGTSGFAVLRGAGSDFGLWGVGSALAARFGRSVLVFLRTGVGALFRKVLVGTFGDSQD